MLKYLFAIMLVLAVAAGTGCSSKALVPPGVDLSAFETVGIIGYDSGTGGTLDAYLNQRFIEIISASQPGVEFLELGPRDALLAELGVQRLDREAIKQIGAHYGVDALIFGRLHISEIKPRVHVFRFLNNLDVHAEVEAKMTAKLVRADRGTMLWAGSARDRRSVANVSVIPGGGFAFRARNPDEAYGDLVNALLHRVTLELRPHYVRR